MTDHDLVAWEARMRRRHSVVVALAGMGLVGMGVLVEAGLAVVIGMGLVLGAAWIRWV